MPESTSPVSLEPNRLYGNAIAAYPGTGEIMINQLALGSYTRGQAGMLIQALEQADAIAGAEFGQGPGRELRSTTGTLHTARLLRGRDPRNTCLLLSLTLDANDEPTTLIIADSTGTTQAVQNLMGLLDVWDLDEIAQVSPRLEVLCTCGAEGTDLTPVALRDLDRDPAVLIYGQ